MMAAFATGALLKATCCAPETLLEDARGFFATEKTCQLHFASSVYPAINGDVDRLAFSRCK